MKRILFLVVLTFFIVTACVPATMPPPTATTTATQTATSLPPTATATVPPPLLSPKQSVECLGGPGTEYPILAELKPGVQYKIIGMNKDGTHRIVSLPEKDQECWVSAYEVQISGNMSLVTEKEIPPTPTPKPIAAPANLQGTTFCLLSSFQKIPNARRFPFITVRLSWEDFENEETAIEVVRDGIKIAQLEKNSTEFSELITTYPEQGIIQYSVQNIASDGRRSEISKLNLPYVCRRW